MKTSIFLLPVFVCLTLAACGKSTVGNSGNPSQPNDRRDLAVKLSFLLTNDLHGHVENLAALGGIAEQIRDSEEVQNNTSALFVLDSGDQFQGTLASNYDEGETMFKSLNAIGYDAIIPGNHDYDFGPIGWLFDKVSAGNTSADPREVIKKVAGIAKFPMLSANTYVKASIKVKDRAGSVPLDSQCVPVGQSLIDALDFEGASRPEFLKPYAIIEKAGVRVALIGLDNRGTASTTTAENVSDLCFRDELSTYLELRKKLEGKADVFVILVHGGNAGPGQADGSELAKQINLAYPAGVNLIAAGHTHYVHNVTSGGVQVIQDGANGKAYGRVDLYYDPKNKKVLNEKTDSAAGIEMSATKCDAAKIPFVCERLKLPVMLSPVITRIVQDANDIIAPLAKKRLGFANGNIYVDRVNESPLGNILTDALRQATGVQVAIMNNGGIRTALKPGDVLYENLFEVSPFQNQAVIIKRFPWKKLKEVLNAAVKTCGKYGSLSQSGLKMSFTRNCGGNTTTAEDYSLVHVELLNGEVLFDKATGLEVDADKTITLATLDFLAAGGDNYRAFGGSVIDETPGIARELIADVFAKAPPTFETKIDGRFENQSLRLGTSTPSPTPPTGGN